MHRKGLLIAAPIAIMMFVFAGCSDDSSQIKYANVNVSTNNELSVTDLASFMLPLNETQKDVNLLDSIKAEVAGNPIDFSSVTYSDDTVCVGDVVYVEGTIPEEDYPPDRILMGADPAGKASFENAVLTNKDGNTILTVNVVGEEIGTTTVIVSLEDSDRCYSFDLEVVDVSDRTAPEYSGYTVYCTPTGGKYHSYGCGYLRGNGIAISLEEALSRGLGPCSRCQY